MKIQRRNTVKLLLACTLLACVFGAHAASFDCAKAKSDVEKMICNDAQTSALDSKLQEAYATALKATDAYGRKALAKEQRNWLKYTRGICQDEPCLQQAYTARIDLLATNQKYITDRSACEIPEGQTCRSVVYMRDPNDRVESFNHSLVNRKKSGRIIGCTKLVDLPVGYANSNDSYGGVCVLLDDAKRKTVEVCNDDMFGHLSMQEASPNATDKELVGFTNSNCYGG